MSVTPLAAAAVPAGVAAVQLARRIQQNQPFRQLLAQLGESAASQGEPSGEASVEAASEAALQQFGALVQQRLKSAGVETSLRFQITSDAQGQLHIAGNHPRQQAIAQALQDDPEIAAAFHRLAEAQHRLHAARQHEHFARQYAVDPLSARFSAQPPAGRFAVEINGDQIEVV